MAVFQRYVVSHAQRDLWSLQKLVPESAAYNVVSAWRIRSRVDDGALAEALVEMANRHDALRTTYRERDGAVWAEVHDRVDGLRLVDARGTTDAELMLHISDEAHRPFDLEHGPVFRPKLWARFDIDAIPYPPGFARSPANRGGSESSLFVAISRGFPAAAALLGGGRDSRRIGCSVRHSRLCMPMFAASKDIQEGSCCSSVARRPRAQSTGGSLTGRILRPTGSRSG